LGFQRRDLIHIFVRVGNLGRSLIASGQEDCHELVIPRKSMLAGEL
jgi:hypothetical protein